MKQPITAYKSIKSSFPPPPCITSATVIAPILDTARLLDPNQSNINQQNKKTR